MSIHSNQKQSLTATNTCLLEKDRTHNNNEIEPHKADFQIIRISSSSRGYSTVVAKNVYEHWFTANILFALTALAIAFVPHECCAFPVHHSLFKNRRQHKRCDIAMHLEIEERHRRNKYLSTPLQNVEQEQNFKSRREALEAAVLTFAALTLVPANVQAQGQDEDMAEMVEGDGYKTSLEDLTLGRGEWTQAKKRNNNVSRDVVPPSFATYAARFLIVNDPGVSGWWKDAVENINSLLPPDQLKTKRHEAFGSLAMSIQLAFDRYVMEDESSKNDASIRERFGSLAELLMEKYSPDDDSESRRQIGLLFATLPPAYQPIQTLKKLFPAITVGSRGEQASGRLPNGFVDDVTLLLPPEYHCAYIPTTRSFAIHPFIDLYAVQVKDDSGQSEIATPFGLLTPIPLKRQQPDITPDIYAMFGISGGAGCALTHFLVVPLDVVKTRLQTDPGQSGDNVIEGGLAIAREEGIGALLLGAQATIVGYLWYGISVYPSYVFFKRFLSLGPLLTPEVATAHTNDVALVAGALAAVLASVGLTPVEACRIRTVAEPEKYRSIGFLGTLNALADEDPVLGWKALYAGFPSLLTRQVIFGSIKFLAFERTLEAIFGQWPFLADETWTSLSVSLVSGGIAGILSAVVSHPADSVLTYVAQNSSRGLGVIDGCRTMIEKEGFGSLFRGVASRCVWAGSIIAGQFLLYDVFRTMFGVNGEDLSQVFEVVITSQASAI